MQGWNKKVLLHSSIRQARLIRPVKRVSHRLKMTHGRATTRSYPGENYKKRDVDSLCLGKQLPAFTNTIECIHGLSNFQTANLACNALQSGKKHNEMIWKPALQQKTTSGPSHPMMKLLLWLRYVQQQHSVRVFFPRFISSWLSMTRQIRCLIADGLVMAFPWISTSTEEPHIFRKASESKQELCQWPH